MRYPPASERAFITLATFGFFLGSDFVFDRMIRVIGEETFQKLQKLNILLIGVGGVGGYALEALVRSGIENITIYTVGSEQKQSDSDLRRRDKGITYLQENEFLVLYFQVL